MSTEPDRLFEWLGESGDDSVSAMEVPGGCVMRVESSYRSGMGTYDKTYYASLIFVPNVKLELVEGTRYRLVPL
jgi:hypothetical protein